MKRSFFGWRTRLKCASHSQGPYGSHAAPVFSDRSFLFSATSCEANRNQWDSHNRPWIVPNKHLNRWFAHGISKLFLVPAPTRRLRAFHQIESDSYWYIDLQPNPLSECPSRANKCYAKRGRTSHRPPVIVSHFHSSQWVPLPLYWVSNVCYIWNKQIFRHLSIWVSKTKQNGRFTIRRTRFGIRWRTHTHIHTAKQAHTEPNAITITMCVIGQSELTKSIEHNDKLNWGQRWGLRLSQQSYGWHPFGTAFRL